MSDHKTGTYVKGASVKYARTPAQAVALVWDGYRRADDAVATQEASYVELQAQAKALGVPANQSGEKLAEAIAAKADETSRSTDLNTQDSGEASPDDEN